MTLRTLLGLPALLVFAYVGMPDAHACSLSQSPQPVRILAEAPANPALFGEIDWQFEDGTPVPVERDNLLTSELGREMVRPTEDISGRTIVGTGPELWSFDWEDSNNQVHVGSAEDSKTPGKPAIKNFELVDYVDPQAGGGGGCGQHDHLSFVVDPIAGAAAIAVWIGDTEQEVLGKLQATGMIGLRFDGNVFVGSYGAGPFPFNQAFCFNIALVDAAGNISERSDVTCVDPEGDDPAVTKISGCATSNGGGAFAWLLLALVAVRLRAARA